MKEVAVKRLCCNRFFVSNHASRKDVVPFQRDWHRSRGFTLVELIMVLVLLGILAVFIAPKFSDPSTFTARGFHDETIAILRYAQKTAIAERRTVCVTIAGTCPTDATRNSVTATIFTKNPATASCTGAVVVACSKTPVADGEVCALQLPFAPACGQGISGTLPGSPPVPIPSFQFAALGSTDQNAAITVDITNSTPITIEAATGYVHD